MKQISLLLLRISLGWLLVIWGADKVFNVEHGMAVANKFYFGFLAAENILQVAGVLQMLVGLAVVVGFARRWVYPVQVLLNSASLLAVAKSVLDPWGWVFSGTNALFYPSLIIFAGSLLLIAFRAEDRWVLERS
ncbi:MAG: DoxX family membrane protein [Gammaproteobacteria bacterium]|nr:DoxX family membrane protein [Gammaproteobacteria bacterium]MBU2155969.1 DoxX family membrane protein [Gammaproteobacteria bacterium]MBU2254498.1 DoxX family membrane protein [Gammaproteobacteria bacterium]MBU2292845.1 DoxX family membrane protein [Gammaproteobacteria bacterium]